VAGFEIVSLDASGLRQSHGPCRARLDAGAAGVVVRGFWDAERAATAAAAVLARRDAWVSDFGGLGVPEASDDDPGSPRVEPGPARTVRLPEIRCVEGDDLEASHVSPCGVCGLATPQGPSSRFS